MIKNVKILILLLVSMILFAVSGIAGTKACNIDAPNSSVEVNVIGWSFEIMDFYADQMKKCGEVKNIDVNVQLQDFQATKEAFRLANAGGGDSPFDIMHVANTGITEFGTIGWFLPQTIL